MDVNALRSPSTVTPETAARAALAALLVVAGCGPLVLPARFPRQPLTVAPGSLLGPFTGRVVDADSGSPIAGALVWCGWSFQRGVGAQAPAAVRTAATRTDADGRYRIPALADLPRGTTLRLARITLVIYHRGHTGYRHDRVFPRGRRRLDFTQLDNLARLRRWSPDLSHAEHLLFIGAGAPIRAASRWERALASAELSGAGPRRHLPRVLRIAPAAPPPGGTAPRPGVTAKLLTADDVRDVTRFGGPLQPGCLADPGGADDTLHLRATDLPERYDVALRLYLPRGGDVDARLDTLRRALPGAHPVAGVGNRAFAVRQGEIYGLAFADRAAGAVALLTCGTGQCTSERRLVALARKVAARLARMHLAPGRPEAPR